MKRGARLAAVLAAAIVVVAGGPVTLADSVAAERQYRVARRLAAEGSAEAAAALRRVVELDPQGPLADDALLDEALLERLPRWPGELGGLAEAACARARGLLDRLLRQHADGDRVDEARYYRALLQLEPLAGHDAAAARLDLLTLATDRDAGEWRRSARYVVGWLSEQQGEAERARATHQRLIVDAPESAAALRARVDLSRLDLRTGDVGRAAARLQALDPAIAGVADLKEAAVRVLLGLGPGQGSGVPAVVATLDTRSLSGFAGGPDGGLVVADRRRDEVLALDAAGATVAVWTIEAPQAVTVGPTGHVFAATGSSVVRLRVGEPALTVGDLGELAPATALAADALGAVWVLGRRGERIGRVAPGGGGALVVWRSEGARLSAMRWDGARLIAVDGRDKKLIAIERDGSQRGLTDGVLQRPLDVAVDPGGRIAVLDGRTSTVLFYDRAGAELARFAAAAAGVGKPVALSFAPDGALGLIDESSGAWMRLP